MWKKIQRDKRHKKQIKLAFLALGILIIFVFIARISNFFFSLGQPFDKNLAVNNYHFFDQNLAVNVIFTTQKPDSKTAIFVASFHPKDKKAIILQISPETFMELPKGMGFWRVGSVYNLGQEEQSPIGAALLRLSVSKLLGLPIDGILMFADNQLPEQRISEWRSNPLKKLESLTKVKTDLNFLEVFNLMNNFSSVRADKLTFLDLAKSTITESKLLPDSSRVLGVDNVKLDLFIRQNLSDENLLEENATVAIFNTTSYPGLAQEAARIVTNLGGNVISISNTDLELDQTLLVVNSSVGNPDTVKFTTQRLTAIFSQQCLNKKCLSQDPKVTSSRAQVNIILGKDFYTKI